MSAPISTTNINPEEDHSSSQSTQILTEHLRYAPIALLDDIINIHNELLYNISTTLDTFLLSQPSTLLGFPTPPITKNTSTSTDDDTHLTAQQETELNLGIHKFETLLENTLDKNFDRFELFVLRNIFKIPPELTNWVRLSHHKDLDFLSSYKLYQQSQSQSQSSSSSPSNPLPLLEQINNLNKLRNTLHTSLLINKKLKSTTQHNAFLIQTMKDILNTSNNNNNSSKNNLSFLSSNTPQDLKPLSESAAFVTSQTSTLLSQLQLLRPKLEKLRELTKSKQQEGRGDSSSMDMDIDNNGEKDNKKEEEEEEKDLLSIDYDYYNDPNVSLSEKRTRYIESQTRRHLQRQRRLRLNRRGEVLGGEYDLETNGGDGSDKKRDLEEVEILESLFGTAPIGESKGGGDTTSDKN